MPFGVIGTQTDNQSTLVKQAICANVSFNTAMEQMTVYQKERIISLTSLLQVKSSARVWKPTSFVDTILPVTSSTNYGKLQRERCLVRN